MPALVLTPTPLEDAMLSILDTVEICDRLKVMRQQESSTYRVFDYLQKHGELLKRVNKPIDEDCRVKMCEWCYQVSSVESVESNTNIYLHQYSDMDVPPSLGTLLDSRHSYVCMN
jgi:hypothetical protein